MKKNLLSVFLIILVISVSGQDVKKLKILHTNDLHSRLLGFSPESAYTPLSINDDNTRGGFARIASIINSEKASSSVETCVFDAGDFFMGTLFPSLEKETGFQLRLMKRMGFDAVGLGNHEFDFGPEWLATVIRTSAEKGEIPQILTSNSVFDPKSSADDGLEKLLFDGVIARKMVIKKGNVRIGVFSILGKDADRVAPKAIPVTFAKQSAVAKRMVKELKAENVDFIVCLSHSGIVADKNGNWSSGDIDLANSVKGIDIIIGGHSHTKIEKPLIVNGTIIVQTGEFGMNVGSLSVSISGGKVSVDDYKLVAIDDKIQGDENIVKLIEDQKNLISSRILSPLGIDYGKAIAENDFIIEGNDGGDYIESNLGPLLADAIHSYVNGKGGKGTDVSMIAAGVLFDKILPGKQIAADLFRVVPLGSGADNIPGYPLARLYVTGKELKSILEILQVAYKSSPDNYCYYSGIRVEYIPDKGMLKKIQKIDIIRPDGTVKNVGFSRKDKTLYSITANSYMLEFIVIIKKMSFGLINVVPKDFAGNRVTDMKNSVIDMDESMQGIQEGKEWLALIEYLSRMRDTTGNGIPDIDSKYSKSIKCFIPVKKNY